MSPFGETADGLERKNPLCVALGDSVTAGFFEWGGVSIEEYFDRMAKGAVQENDYFMIMDVRECYLEKFRSRLTDYFKQTLISTVNSGIAGDTMYGMEKRVYRDVIWYRPDLVIINGALNWGAECGTTENYKAALTRVLAAIQEETWADVVLLTPNMAIIPPVNINPKSCLEERVEVIRTLANERSVCLADTYKVWKEYERAGYPIKVLLANGMTHPSVTGHEVYADLLMKLIEQPGVHMM